ncbi:MAG TPA: GntR family transcriptional regulator [Terrimesophilobacter sp.]|nr:GntR family transcriptional regulator [Terrimesophilobacter sp.]
MSDRSFFQVNAPSLADEIAFQLQADILAGLYGPGEHLPQDELCVRFSVSRTPIREALRKLHEQNLVTLVPNRGATVKAPTLVDFEEVYVTRAQLEGFSAELAAAKWTPDDDLELLSAQAKLKAFVGLGLKVNGGSPEADAAMSTRIANANEEFHAVIHSVAGNARLRRVIVELQNSVPVSQVWHAVREGSQAEELNIRDHEAIASALRDRDAPRAREAMCRHVERAGRSLIEHLESSGFWNSTKSG